MKLLRVGEKGQEKVAAIDSDNLIRDLSQYINDLFCFHSQFSKKRILKHNNDEI